MGHELRTPLSTIRICLESLASEPDMPLEFKNTMIDGLVEVFDKLLDNACKLTPDDGEIVVTAKIVAIEAQPEVAQNSKMVEVIVADTGS